jgi:voltage-gated potassium channel
MTSDIYEQMHKKFLLAGIVLLVILVVGTAGYWYMAGKEHSLLDCLYMVIITISTIGYGEIIELSHHPWGRIFTIFIAISGIGVLFYILTNFTAYVVEGELRNLFWRRKMEKKASDLSGHYIVCGAGNVGVNILNELLATNNSFIAVDISRSHIENLAETIKDQVWLQDDASDNNTLLNAGIERARGLFAVTGDDYLNLVISLTARQLNPNIRIVARCKDIKNAEKIRKAGADAVISPNFIGGLRMASEMIRPTVVSFLDKMLRDKEKNLRIEEVSAPDSFHEKPIEHLYLKQYPSVLLLALNREGKIHYNPPENFVIKPKDTLIFMCLPEEKRKLRDILSS